MKIIPILKQQLVLLKLINENNTRHKDHFSVGWQELIERVIGICDTESLDAMEKTKIIHKETIRPYDVYDNKRGTVLDYLAICWGEQKKYLDERQPYLLRTNAKKDMNEIAEALEEVFYFKCPFLK
jgi:hypothetical protein